MSSRFLIRDNPDHPPRLHSRSEFALFYVLLAFTVVVGLFDLAGATTNWFDGGTFALVGLTRALRFVIADFRHGGDPAAGWWAVHRAPFPAIAFWTVLATAACALSFGFAFACRRVTGRWSPPIEDGFASVSALNEVASGGAAASRVAQTRPSLVGATAAARDVGYPMGRSVRPSGVELRASWETSLELVAPTGVGKTMRVLARILRQHPGPAFATSTKADFYEVSVGARRDVGSIFALDPENLAPAADRLHWSPVLGCGVTSVAERRAAALIAANGETSDLRSGAFFRQSAVAVLGAYLHAAALSGSTMADIVRWAARPTDAAPRRILTEKGDQQIDWASRLVEHTTGAEETTSGVMRTVDLALACFRHREVLELCSVDADDAFDFETALTENATVYALGKDRSAGSIGAGALITAFAEEFLLAAEQLASRQPGRRLDPPLLAILDEAPSIVPLPGLPALVADGRGRGITVVYAMQSFSQAIERWGKTGAATMRNATTITAVFGGLSVPEDLKELSELCGTRKVLRHSANTEWRRGTDSIGATWVDEPVLTPAEIRALPEGTLLLLWGRLGPILAYEPGVWEGPDAALIAEQEAAARKANDECRDAMSVA
jgi:hypothetical protein